ncbi:MAG TPA: trypsin-like peptidase domain-containing protein [Kofleriaceae bacterium]|nr:trypsin-like peptidase domain-containing protein [Kofleriaceae bacterium]
MAQPAQNVFHALDQALAAAVEAAARSVVHVARGHGNGGTGIAWASDLVISASFHTPDRTTVGIASDDGEVDRRSRIAGGGDPDGSADGARVLPRGIDRRDAEVIGRDPGTDVALLRVAGGGLTPATFRDLGSLAVGNLALALGRPGRSVRASLRAIGVLGPAIRTPHGGKLDRYVESDRQVPRGFAGGPLIDADGAVIGMNTRTLFRGEDLAIPTQTLRRVVDELAAHGGIRRGYLGVGAYPAQLPAALAQLAGRDRGALVASVEDGAPAALAGVLVGDILVELAGTPITDPDSLRLALGDRPGETLELTVLRGGAKLALSVTLGSRP